MLMCTYLLPVFHNLKLFGENKTTGNGLVHHVSFENFYKTPYDLHENIVIL